MDSNALLSHLICSAKSIHFWRLSQLIRYYLTNHQNMMMVKQFSFGSIVQFVLRLDFKSNRKRISGLTRGRLEFDSSSTRVRLTYMARYHSLAYKGLPSQVCPIVGLCNDCHFRHNGNIVNVPRNFLDIVCYRLQY